MENFFFSFWWLVFPLGFFIADAFDRWLSYKKSQATAGGFLLWALWPALGPMLGILSQGLAPVGACLTLAAAAVVLLDGRVIPVVRRNHG